MFDKILDFSLDLEIEHPFVYGVLAVAAFVAVAAVILVTLSAVGGYIFPFELAPGEI
jgi:hypothetical protein